MHSAEDAGVYITCSQHLLKRGPRKLVACARTDVERERCSRAVQEYVPYFHGLITRPGGEIAYIFEFNICKVRVCHASIAHAMFTLLLAGMQNVAGWLTAWLTFVLRQHE